MPDPIIKAKKVRLTDLGLTDYKEAWDIQEKLLEQAVGLKLGKKDDSFLPLPDNHLILCEHPPVYTLGKSGSEDNLLLSPKDLVEKHIQFFHNNRGGDITFHGPGQVVGYPILDLDQFTPDIGKYMNSLEEVIIRTIAEYGLKGERIKGSTGVWLDSTISHRARKICAFGVRTSRWITMHGWALNVNTDLNYFNFIVPCGISDKGVTSMQKELGREVDIEEVKEKVKNRFEEVFGVRLVS